MQVFYFGCRKLNYDFKLFSVVKDVNVCLVVNKKDIYSCLTECKSPNININ